MNSNFENELIGLKNAKDRGLQDIKDCTNVDDLKLSRSYLIGKAFSILEGFMSRMKCLSPRERAIIGPQINEFKHDIGEAFDLRREELERDMTQYKTKKSTSLNEAVGEIVNKINKLEPLFEELKISAEKTNSAADDLQKSIIEKKISILELPVLLTLGTIDTATLLRWQEKYWYSSEIVAMRKDPDAHGIADWDLRELEHKLNIIDARKIIEKLGLTGFLKVASFMSLPAARLLKNSKLSKYEMIRKAVNFVEAVRVII